MATMRESTSLMMAAAENNFNDHSWLTETVPVNRKPTRYELYKGGCMVTTLIFFLAVGVFTIVISVLYPSGIGSGSNTRRNPEGLVTMVRKVDEAHSAAGHRKLGTVANPALPEQQWTEMKDVKLDETFLDSMPSIKVSGDRRDLYTLILVAADLNTSLWQKSESAYIHWMVVNLHGGSHVRKGNHVVTYEHPEPLIKAPLFLVVIKQHKQQVVRNTFKRFHEQFHLRDFTDQFQLGSLVNAVQFRYADSQ